ncbi:MAG: phosphatidylglycerophosphatase A [Ghiorsea sp.]
MANSTLWILKWLAAGLGSGWLPKAPGTWGSLFALIPAWYILNQFGLNGLWLAIIIVTLCGFIVCYYLLPVLVKLGQSHDPGWIVIDEWAGLWLNIAILLELFPTLDLQILLPLAFILFRGFDIIKPFPIKRVETWGPHWFSIMNDDLVAGVMGSVLGIILLKLFL